MIYKTPGVYIEEQNAFPNSVVQVATAVPVFVGYTEKAEYNGQKLSMMPTAINSLFDYENFFGKAPQYKFKLIENSGAAALSINGKHYNVVPDAVLMYRMYNSMRLFYANGGGRCYIVSVGNYNTQPTLAAIQAGIDTLEKEQEPTMLVAPDALLLSNADYNALMNYMLAHCEKMQNRIAILDTYTCSNVVADMSNFRTAIQENGRKYGAAYYPWLNTTITLVGELNYTQFADLKNYIEPQAITKYEELMQKAATAGVEVTDNGLTVLSANYKAIKATAQNLLNVLPPSAAMAGVYTAVDMSRGVWKAPANVSLNAVAGPVLLLSNADQEDMNVPGDGKAVNAIRTFVGHGVLVWGARTLDGNSNDWRYINVRRTMIMIEQSIKLACQAYVFEPNVANTWVSVKGMLENFLINLWRQGALVGAKPEDAFNVQVGLGATMTPQDILDGIMNVTVMVAIVRPAEFIVITIQQQMQTS